MFRRTPSSSRPSSLWRGMMVTSSISHKKATSEGVRPDGRGSAMCKDAQLSAFLGKERLARAMAENPEARYPITANMSSTNSQYHTEGI